MSERPVPDHELSGPALEIAQAFHEAYERLAPGFGYETRQASAKPWQDVPVQNRALMVAVALELMQEGVIFPRTVALQSSRVVLKAELWDLLLDKDNRGGHPRPEALRGTARGAVEDWQEAIAGAG